MNTFMHNLTVRQAQNLPSHIRTHNTLIETVEYRDSELQRQLRIAAIERAVHLCQGNNEPAPKVKTFDECFIEFFDQPVHEFEILHLEEDGYVTYADTLEQAVETNGM